MGRMKDLAIKLEDGSLSAITDAELRYLDEMAPVIADRVRRFRSLKRVKSQPLPHPETSQP